MASRADGYGKEVWRYQKDGEWKQSSYTGTMRNGKPHGHDVYVWANGNRYEGDYRDGKKHGRGKYTFAHGDNCEGDWREDRLLGTGDGYSNGQFKKCYLDGDTIKYAD